MGITTAAYTRDSQTRYEHSQSKSTEIRRMLQSFLDQFNLTPDSVVAERSGEIREKIHEIITALHYGPVRGPIRGLERDGFTSASDIIAELDLIRQKIDECEGEVVMNTSELNRAARRCSDIEGDKISITREEMMIRIKDHPIGRTLHGYMQEGSKPSPVFSLLIGLVYMSINNPEELFTMIGIRNTMCETLAIPNRSVIDHQIRKLVETINIFARKNGFRRMKLVKNIRTEISQRKTKHTMTLRIEEVC